MRDQQRIVVVDAGIELRLRRSAVVVSGIGRGRYVADLRAVAWNLSGRARQRILRKEAGRQLIRPSIVDRLRVRAAGIPERTRPFPAGSAKGSDAERRTRPLHLARRLGDHVDDAVESVCAPDRRGRAAEHFNLLDLVQVDRQEIPHDEAKHVLIEAAAVQHREKSRSQCSGRTTSRDVDVARRNLSHVQTWNGAQQLGEVRRGRLFDRLGSDDRDGRGSIGDLLWSSRNDIDRLFILWSVRRSRRLRCRRWRLRSRRGLLRRWLLWRAGLRRLRCGRQPRRHDNNNGRHEGGATGQFHTRSFTPPMNTEKHGCTRSHRISQCRWLSDSSRSDREDS